MGWWRIADGCVIPENTDKHPLHGPAYNNKKNRDADGYPGPVRVEQLHHGALPRRCAKVTSSPSLAFAAPDSMALRARKIPALTESTTFAA